MENLCIFLAAFHVIITVIVRYFFRRCSTWTLEQIFNLQISSAAALQPFVRRAHQIVILHLPPPLPPAHPYLHLIHRKVRVPNTLLQILCIYHACGRIGFEIGVGNAPRNGRGETNCVRRVPRHVAWVLVLNCFAVAQIIRQSYNIFYLSASPPSLSPSFPRVIALFISASAYV